VGSLLKHRAELAESSRVDAASVRWFTITADDKCDLVFSVFWGILHPTEQNTILTVDVHRHKDVEQIPESGGGNFLLLLS